jgi:hypothetical protein
VLKLLQDSNWKVKESKYAFAQRSIAYLGYVIDARGVATDPSEVLDVQKWPTPTNLKELRGFLGLSGFYRKFVKHYGVICQPLTHLLRKNVPFIWTAEAQKDFDTLKVALTTAPVLVLPDFSIPFEIETDACESGVGAVLLQRGHQLAYVSLAWVPALAASPPTRRSTWRSSWPLNIGACICNMLSS